MWGYIPIIPGLGRIRQENIEFEVSLGFIMKSCFKKTKDWRCSSVVEYLPSMPKTLD
jgi:hypothetical protein